MTSSPHRTGFFIIHMFWLVYDDNCAMVTVIHNAWVKITYTWFPDTSYETYSTTSNKNIADSCFVIFVQKYAHCVKVIFWKSIIRDLYRCP